MTFIDITRPLHTGMAVWPGDTAAEFTLVATKAAGASCNVGRLRLSVHSGTHADAPFHYDDAGATIDALPPERFIGPARVVDVRGHATLTPATLAGQDFADTPRVLFRTDAWAPSEAFPPAWPLLAPDLPAWLAARDVGLVGLDVPSVDAPDSKDLALHHALDRAGILILENLDLRGVEPGVYELIALPLRVRGGDGSPIRAVLRRE